MGPRKKKKKKKKKKAKKPESLYIKTPPKSHKSHGKNEFLNDGRCLKP
jgi:hypothetical protein